MISLCVGRFRRHKVREELSIAVVVGHGALRRAAPRLAAQRVWSDVVPPDIRPGHRSAMSPILLILIVILIDHFFDDENEEDLKTPLLAC